MIEIDDWTEGIVVGDYPGHRIDNLSLHQIHSKEECHLANER